MFVSVPGSVLAHLPPPSLLPPSLEGGDHNVLEVFLQFRQTLTEHLYGSPVLRVARGKEGTPHLLVEVVEVMHLDHLSRKLLLFSGDPVLPRFWGVCENLV